MRAFGLTVLTSTALLFALACNQPATETITQDSPATLPSPAASVDQFASTRLIFNKSCAGCHSEDGTGGLKEVDGKKLKVPTLREGHALNHSDDDFLKQITKGGDGMPAFADKLTPEQMSELVRLIRHDFQGK